MRREIKFRAKCKDNGDWVYGSYIANYNNNDWIVQGVDFFAVDRRTVGQFIGRCDKDGKEIYEGDILHDVSMNREYAVYFSDITCAFCFPALDFVDLQNGITYKWRIGSNEHIQVVGNKYDNPVIIDSK